MKYSIPIYFDGVKTDSFDFEEGDETWQALMSAFHKIPNAFKIEGEYLVELN